jgi:hypothetical protein
VSYSPRAVRCAPYIRSKNEFAAATGHISGSRPASDAHEEACLAIGRAHTGWAAGPKKFHVAPDRVPDGSVRSEISDAYFSRGSADKAKNDPDRAIADFETRLSCCGYRR